jgi:hypothetical protein
MLGLKIAGTAAVIALFIMIFCNPGNDIARYSVFTCVGVFVVGMIMAIWGM